MKKKNKMNLLELMETARNWYDCSTVRIMSGKKVEGLDVQEVIYYDSICHAVSSENNALMLLNYLKYDSYFIDDNTLVVLCKF